MDKRTIDIFVAKIIYHCGIRKPFEIIQYSDSEIKIRIPKEKKEYTVKVWKIDDRGLDFTLYNDNQEEIIDERYYFSTCRFYKRRNKK